MKTQTASPWDIETLEKFFKENTLPPPPIKLNVVCHITNVRAFIDSHIDILKENEGKETYLPYLQRLYQLKDWIENNKSNT
jgi:hypothetical protein